MRNFVIINGVNSNTINGLGINELPPITKPEMRNIREEIDGRDGDIITELGYSAYDKTITIGLFGTGYDINDIVAFFNGEGTIVFSNEDDKYYKYKILNQIDYESLQKFRTASITFHCQPFKYPLSETPLEIEYDYIEDEGETLSLNNTGNATMTLALKGNTSQSGTPTPTSPIPVSVVSGDNDVVVCGKNIFNSEVVQGFYTADGGTSTSNTQIRTTEYIEVVPNTTYTFSNANNLVIDRICYYNSSKTFIERGAYLNSGTFTTLNNSCKYIRFTIRASDGSNITPSSLDKPMLEKSSSATSYEPYQSQTYEVDLPVENLLDISDITSGNGITNNGDGSITLQGGVTSNSFSLTTPFVLKANQTYTLSITNTNSSYSASTFILRNGNTNIVVLSYNLSSVNYTPTQDTTIDTLRIFNGGNTFDNFTFYPQLEVGSKQNKWQPYGQTPIELCKIGTYQDYFTKNSDGQWCKYNAIGKAMMVGTETGWATNQSTDDKIRFSCPNITQGAGVNNTGYSNYFLVITETAKNGISIYDTSSVYVWIAKSVASDVASFQTWLTTHNTEIYYILKTPYLSLIEDNNLIEQLDNIQNAMSYEGTTNIGQVNNDKAFIISAKALEDGTNEVVVNNIGNVYSKPLLALEGSGNVDIYLDNTQILKANVEDKMNIDIAQLEAYNPDTMTLLNRQVIGNYNSMTLQPGNNTIRIDGALDKATITNYTRYL